MHLNHQAVRSGGNRRARKRLHHPRNTRGMRRVDNHRQMRLLFNQRHSGNIQIVADHLLKRPNAAFTEDDVRVAARQHIFSAHQPLLDRRRKTALEQNRLIDLAQRFEQPEILHVARTNLNHIDVGKVVDLRFAHDLRDNRQTRFPLRFQQKPESFVLKSLEGIRRCARFKRAAAQAGCAALFHIFGDGNQLLPAFHRTGPGDHGKRTFANHPPADIDVGILGMKTTVRQFIRFGNAPHIFDDIACAQPVFIHVRRITDEA